MGEDERYPEDIPQESVPIGEAQEEASDILKRVTEIKPYRHNKDGANEGHIPAEIIRFYSGILSPHASIACYDKNEYAATTIMLKILLHNAYSTLKEKGSMCTTQDENDILGGFFIASSKVSMGKQGRDNILDKIRTTITETKQEAMHMYGEHKGKLTDIVRR